MDYNGRIIKMENLSREEIDERLDLIRNWLREHYIYNFVIKRNGLISVSGIVDLTKFDIEELPEFIQFDVVDFFYINDNPRLKSRRGFPNNCIYTRSDI